MAFKLSSKVSSENSVNAARNATSSSLNALKDFNQKLVSSYSTGLGKTPVGDTAKDLVNISEYTDKFLKWNPQEKKLRPHVLTAPNALYADAMDEGQWRSEQQLHLMDKDQSYAEAAGSAPVVNEIAPQNFAWNPYESDPVSSEYQEKYLPWVQQEIPNRVIKSVWSPNAIDIEALDSSQWASESHAVFRPPLIDENYKSAAGVANAKTNALPSNFAWKLMDKFAGVEAGDPNILPGGRQSEPASRSFESQTESSRSYIWPEASQRTVSSGRRLTAPNAIYPDALDSSKWESEYHSRCADLRAETRRLVNETNAIKVAGIPNLVKTISPSYFAWTPSSEISSQPPKLVASITERDSIEGEILVGQLKAMTTEYKDNFHWPSPAKKFKTSSLPTSHTLGIYDFSEPASWLTEYDDRFASLSSMERPMAPLPPECAQALSNNSSSDTTYLDTAETIDICDDRVNPAKVAFQESVHSDQDASVLDDQVSMPDRPKHSQGINYTKPNYDSHNTSIEPSDNQIHSQLDSASMEDILKRSERKRYSTEYDDRYKWFDANHARVSAKPTMTGMDAIFGTGPFSKSNKKSDEAPSVSKIDRSILYTTESGSRYLWPDTTMTLQNYRPKTADTLNLNGSTMTTDSLSIPKLDNSLSTSNSAVEVVPPTSIASVDMVKSHHKSSSVASAAEGNTWEPLPSYDALKRYGGGFDNRWTNPSEKQLPGSDGDWTQPTTAMKLRGGPFPRDGNHSSDRARPRSAPTSRKIHTGKRINFVHDDFNPIFFHRRYPQNSDKQNGRWTTESSSKYTWRKPKSP